MKKQAFKFFLGFSSLFWLPDQTFSVLVLVSAVVFLLLSFIIQFKVQRRDFKNAILFNLSRFIVYNRLIWFGFVWASLNILVWSEFSNKTIVEPHKALALGFPCSVISDDNYVKSKSVKSKSIKSKNHKRHSITFDFCITHIKKLEDESAIFESQHAINPFSNNKLKMTLYRTTADKIAALLSGKLMVIETKVKPNHGRINPAGFDYEKWLAVNGYIGTGYVRQLNLYENESHSIDLIVTIAKSYHNIRQKIYSKIEKLTFLNQYQGLILALSVGEKSLIPQEQWDTFIGSGTSHLLAISGLHIGIAAIWSYYLVFFLIKSVNFFIGRRVFINPIKPALVASILGAISISVISGLGYPAQRAMLMLLIFIMAKRSKRHYSMSSILSITFLCICLIQPFSILSTSFWLSFSAVSIILFAVSFKSQSNSQYPKVKAWLRVNWFIFIALMPVTLLFFGQVSLVSLGANLILIPVTSFMTAPLVYLALLSSAFSENLARGLFELADYILEVSYYVQNWFASTNALLLDNNSLPNSYSFVLLASVICLLIILPKKLVGQYLLAPIALLIVFSTVSQTNINETKDWLNINSATPAPEFKMIVFDIGQGLGIYINANGKHLIYDTGYGNSEFSFAESVMLPYLKKEHIKSIDKLIISHGDTDHRGGLETILENFQVNELLSGEILYRRDSINDPSKKVIKNQKPIDSTNCHTYPKWKEGGVKFEFLNYNQQTKLTEISSKLRSSNNQSCVLSISVKGKKILLTGDIEKQAEQRLLHMGIKSYDVIVAPHHGSLTSSGSNFLASVLPKTGIFSAGYANQWHFPKKTIVDRYLSLGAQTIVTYQSGAIVVELIGDSLQITKERSKRRHFWNAKDIH